jgi:hypothetical protein
MEKYVQLATLKPYIFYGLLLQKITMMPPCSQKTAVGGMGGRWQKTKTSCPWACHEGIWESEGITLLDLNLSVTDGVNGQLHTLAAVLWPKSPW